MTFVHWGFSQTHVHKYDDVDDVDDDDDDAVDFRFSIFSIPFAILLLLRIDVTYGHGSEGKGKETNRG